MVKHYNIRIYGQVHGVFFRDFAKEKADFLGVFGFVQNEPDGAVYIEAEGEEDKLDEFINLVKQGPSIAKINRIEMTEDQVKNYNGFEIRYI